MDTQLKIEMLDINNIVPNDYNPNKMQEADYENLKQVIIRDGFDQHILVRPHDIEAGKYIIIDGEHRWKILKELGATLVPAAVQMKTRSEAMVKTITMNKFRGDFDTIKLAEVIVELQKEHSSEELAELLGYTTDEQKMFVEMLSFDPTQMPDSSNNELDNLQDQTEDNEMLNDFTVAVDIHGLDMIATALSTINDDQAVALYEMSKSYLSVTYPDKLQEVMERKGKLGQATIDAQAGIVQ